MDVLSFVFSEENVRTLLLLVAIIGAKVSMERSFDRKMSGLATREEMNAMAASLRQEMNALAASLRREMAERLAELGASLRQEMDERFTALKTNDLAHLHQVIKAFTFTLMKNGTLEPKDKEYIDSQLDG